MHCQIVLWRDVPDLINVIFLFRLFLCSFCIVIRYKKYIFFSKNNLWLYLWCIIIIWRFPYKKTNVKANTFNVITNNIMEPNAFEKLSFLWPGFESNTKIKFSFFIIWLNMVYRYKLSFDFHSHTMWRSLTVKSLWN
jgi:hypothetical protein